MTQITPFTAVPNRGMSQETLVTTTNTFFSEVGGFVGQANQLIGDINTAATNAIFTAPDWVAQAYESHKVVIYTDHNVYMSTEATLSTDVPSVSAKWKQLGKPSPSLDSIVILSSGTSWTCPEGVSKVKLTMVGGGGGGVSANGYVGPSGAGAGGLIAFFNVSAGTSYTYSIGAGGASSTGGATAGTGGNTTFIANAITYTANGGGGGNTSTAVDGGSSSGTGAILFRGSASTVSAFSNGYTLDGGVSIFGKSGGRSSNASSGSFQQNGVDGKIILELYK